MTGGHTDAVTGSDCHWNVFRVCNTTRMETNSVSKLLFDKFGKKWYFITPDYAFGHTLQQGFEASLKKFGGTEVGASLTPLGTTDFSPYPDQGAGRESGRHHLPDGRRRRGQLAQAGRAVRPRQAIPHRRRAAGARGARGPAARGADRHLGVRVVLEPAERAARQGIRRRHPQEDGGKVPTARHWFGYASVWTCALVANEKKTLEARSSWPRRSRTSSCRRRWR